MKLNANRSSNRKAVALGLAPLLVASLATAAVADPLDPDRSFGHKGDGTVTVDRSLGHHGQALGVRKRSTYVAYSALGGGSGEYSAAVVRFGRRGLGRDSMSGSLEDGRPFPSAATTFRSGRRVFSIGWAERVNYGPPYGVIGGYGFVAAFQAHRPNGPHWGTERFADGDRGLERLREIPLSSVAGGAIDRAGRVVVVGRHAGDVIVTRLTAGGAIDRSFGNNGYVRLFARAGSAHAFDVATDQRNRILVAGRRVNSAGGSRGFVIRLNPDGTRSSTWSGDGLRRIGASGTSVRGIEAVRPGRWLVGYERQRTDRVKLIELGRLGRQHHDFGRHGTVSVRCRARADGPSLLAMTLSRRHDAPDRVAAFMVCKKSGDQLQRAGIWFANGKSVPSLGDNGVGRLPWNRVTIDAKYTGRGKLMALYGQKLIRLHG